jgi:hypothetical protein
VANVTIAYSVFAVIADLIFGILPIFVIWDLKMNKKAKMIVGGLLMLGILSVPLPLPSTTSRYSDNLGLSADVLGMGTAPASQ